jgi:hypothetical protein
MPPDGGNPARQVPLDLNYSSDQRFLAAIREIVTPLATRFEGQDKALDRVASRVETIAQDVAHLRMELRYRRRDLRGAKKRRHLIDIRAMGGRCPCCGSAEVPGCRWAAVTVCGVRPFLCEFAPGSRTYLADLRGMPHGPDDGPGAARSAGGGIPRVSEQAPEVSRAGWAVVVTRPRGCHRLHFGNHGHDM